MARRTNVTVRTPLALDAVIEACTRSALEATASQLRAETKGAVEPITVDTTNSRSAQDLVAVTVKRFGSVHILVNCAAAPGGLVCNNIELVPSWEAREKIGEKAREKTRDKILARGPPAIFA